MADLSYEEFMGKGDAQPQGQPSGEMSYEDFMSQGKAINTEPAKPVSKPNPDLIENSLKTLKAIGGESAALADVVLSLPALAIGTGVNLGVQANAMLHGESGKITAQAGREGSAWVNSYLGNPLQKVLGLFSAIAGGDPKTADDLYADTLTTKGLGKLTNLIGEAGKWVEKTTNGQVPGEQVQTMADVMMLGLGSRGLDMSKGVAKAKAEMPFEPKEATPEQAVQQGPARTAQADINESLNIKSKAERDAWTKKRQADVKTAFRDDAEYADYLKAAADERVQLREDWTKEVAQRDAMRAKHEELFNQQNTVDTAKIIAEPDYVSQGQLMKILQKPGFERTADDMLNLKAFNRQQGGSIDPRLLARMAAVGLGTTAGLWLDPENPVEGGLLGAAAGFFGASSKPREAVQSIKNIFKPDARIRINDLADMHEYQTAAAARNVWQTQGKIEKMVPDVTRRAAITSWIEGDKSIDLSPRELDAAKLVQTYFADMAKAGQESGVLKDSLTNYVTHLWEKNPKANTILNEIFAEKPGGPSMSGESRFAMQRSIPTIAKGKELGLTPLTEDISSILGIYGNAVSRSMANKQLLTALKTAKTPEGVKLIEPFGRAPAGFVAIDHPQMAGLRVNPEIAPSLKFIFDTKDPGVVMRGLEGLNILTKRMNVSFSLFHAKALADAFIGAAKNPLKVGKELGQAISPKIFGENAMLKQMREGGAGDLVDMAQKGGLKFSMEREGLPVEDVGGTFYTALKDLQKGMDSVIPGTGKPVELFAKVNHKVDNFMWGRLHAGMKLSIFAEKYATLLENNARAHSKNPMVPLLPKEKIAGMASSFTNDIFGGLNWRRVAEEAKTKWGRDIALAALSPTGRRINQILLFAPDWTLSTVRAATKAFGTDLLHSPLTSAKGVLKPQTLKDLHRQYVLRSAVYYMVIGDAVNYAMSGHHLADNKDPTTLDLGDGRRMQWSKHTMEPVHWMTKPGQQSLNKLGYIPREAANQMLGTEYLSTSGHAPRMGNRVAHAAKGFSPIAVQQSYEASSGSGIAGFLGVPIYGKTQKEKDAAKELKRIRKLKEGK